jgi:hypothetical protein
MIGNILDPVHPVIVDGLVLGTRRVQKSIVSVANVAEVPHKVNIFLEYFYGIPSVDGVAVLAIAPIAENRDAELPFVASGGRSSEGIHVGRAADLVKVFGGRLQTVDCDVVVV